MIILYAQYLLEAFTLIVDCELILKQQQRGDAKNYTCKQTFTLCDTSTSPSKKACNPCITSKAHQGLFGIKWFWQCKWIKVKYDL